MTRRILLSGLWLLVLASCAPRPTPAPARQEPLIPTVPAQATVDGGVETPTRAALARTAQPDPDPGTSSETRARLGVGAPREGGPLDGYAVHELGIGWYLNWGVEVKPARPGGAAFWQMVRLSSTSLAQGGRYRPDAETIRAAARANPGSTWLIGNEPDVAWQDNVAPERYAELYHELYELLKAADPVCQVAIAGISQPTPLRLAYLERVLDAYQARYGAPIPVDVWNVHGFVLREERDSWGVGIPPGFEVDAGVLYEIEDHGDLERFQDQVLTFRRWMAEHGQRERPLVLSEFGILMPADYGFDPQTVQEFMYAAFDYLNGATDKGVGCPEDGNRLVQWWAWYSLADTAYPTGNLFDPETKALTDLGRAFRAYTASANDDRH